MFVHYLRFLNSLFSALFQSLKFKMANIIRRYQRRIYLRRERLFRDRLNPLEFYDDLELYKRFRFDRHSIMYITEMLQLDLQRPTERNLAIPVRSQVLVALRFYATGSFQVLVGDSYGIHKSTVSRIIHRVSRALARQINNFITFPTTLQEMNQSKHLFYNICGFPNTIGAIDCTHVKIQAPVFNENDYVDRKGQHSLNIQCICDANNKLINIVARWPGSCHDARILRESQVSHHFENNEVDAMLIGDNGYPCKDWLMVPFLNPVTNGQQMYNSSLTRTRVIIEQTFGILKRRFHSLHGELRYTPEKACTIITACAVLHNIAINNRLPANFENEDYINDENDRNNAYQGHDQNGFLRRDQIVAAHFN